jgi:predicted metalloprotease
MRLEGGRKSSNVEDRRKTGRAAAPLGCGSILIVVAYLLLGGDPEVAVQVMSDNTAQTTTTPTTAPEDDEAAELVQIILADTEDVWSSLFAQAGRQYPAPTLVLFSDAVRSACGNTSSAVGPFYCPGDQQIYIDLSFYRELSSRFGAPGDFAQAYVLAHEVGHHIQTVLGINQEISQQQRQVSEADANALSVRMELQADCLAGVWAHHAHQQRQILEVGDVEEGLRAAAAIGDDRLQKQTQGYTVPESWTHGSSEQRVRWLTLGLKGGDFEQCDTFSASRL